MDCVIRNQSAHQEGKQQLATALAPPGGRCHGGRSATQKPKQKLRRRTARAPGRLKIQRARNPIRSHRRSEPAAGDHCGRAPVYDSRERIFSQ